MKYDSILLQPLAGITVGKCDKLLYISGFISVRLEDKDRENLVRAVQGAGGENAADIRKYRTVRGETFYRRV